jgi:hypothetical protein
MKRLVYVFGVNLIVAATTITSLFMGGCTADESGEGFAVYLTQDDVPPSQMEALSHVEIADRPVISEDDVVYYNPQTHELKLTQAAFERISGLDVPVQGRSFVVCVDKGPIYWGAFWTPVSSQSFDGVTIWKPLGSELPPVVTLELGYPTSSFYGGEDPRNSGVVLQSLEQGGKLVTALTINDVDELPSSMKGYELYSWQQDGQWNFTLITGTNRIKYPEEIISGEDIISETGWIKISVSSVEEIETVLSKLPGNEEVFWSEGLMSSAGVSVMELPPEPIVSEIKEFAAGIGLNLAVS